MTNEEIVKELRDVIDCIANEEPITATRTALTIIEKLQPKPNCDWCGKGGKLVVKHYHKECHEAILNGEGV